MSERGKTAIIMVGGGMRSAHGGGFLYALDKQLHIPPPDILIGSSGNAGNVLYYCAGQSEKMKRIWVELLPSYKFISLWRFWRVMNIDYVIDEVFKKQEPLDVEKVLSSPIEWVIPLSDFDTGATRYVSAADRLDPLEILRAASAVPLYFRKRISIAHHRYIDGELGSTLQDHVVLALGKGAREIVIVNHCVPWTRMSSLIMRLWAHFVPLGMQEAIVRDISTDAKLFSAPHARVLFVSPQYLACGHITHKEKSIKATFDRGVQDALALKDELRILFAS